MKGSKSTPVYVLDEHNEAFYSWQLARIDGYLTGPVDLFHIDAHDDMGRPARFGRSIYFHGPSLEAELEYYMEFSRAELNIANFIFPAILAGLIRNVYFIYPKWRKFKPARRKWSICSAFGEGVVLKYGIHSDAANNPMVTKAFPDLKTFSYFKEEAPKLPQNREVILDIDLDYFACRDSTYNHMAYELEITGEQFQNKDIFLSEKTMPFSGFEFSFSENEGRYFARIERKKGIELFHLPTEAEIEHEIDTLVEVLKGKRIKPSVVTICRSCNSGFCPAEYSRFIERHLIEKIQPLLKKQNCYK